MCYVCLQNVLALTQGSTLPAQLVQPLTEPICAVHTSQPHAWLRPWAQDKHHVWGRMHTGRSSSHTPFRFFSWACRTRQFASMLPTSFHPKECCLSGHLDKDSCPLNIQVGATYKAFILLFSIQPHCTCFLRKQLLQPGIWLTKLWPRINYSFQDMDTGVINS